MSRLSGNVYVDGTLSAKTVVPSAGSILDAHVGAGADIAYTKNEQQRAITYGQNSTMAAATQIVHRVYGATGTILAFHAGSVTLCTGNAQATVDLKLNGTTVLAGVITLDSANTARVGEAGTLSVTSLAVGDVLEVVVTVNAGTGALGTGLFATVVLAEDPQ